MRSVVYLSSGIGVLLCPSIISPRSYMEEVSLGGTSSYFVRRSSASLRFVNLASVIAFIASTYFLNVGDKRLEIGAFSIEMIPLGKSGLVNDKYNATFAPLILEA